MPQITDFSSRGAMAIPMGIRNDLAGQGCRRVRPAPCMELPRRKLRVVLYSHDTMGLGHMRRNLLIAQTLMGCSSPPVVLMIAGAREAGALPLPGGVDCLTLPSLGKDAEGRTCCRSLDLNLSTLLTLRSKTIAAALDAFAPDVLIVDKVPRGAGYELDASLAAIRSHGLTRCVLGLRDVLDDPEAVRREWREARTDDIISTYYDAVWVYGDPALYDPVQEYDFALEVADKVRFTGYLDRRIRLQALESGEDPLARLGLPDGQLILCQLGGGQDGAALAEAFIHARLPEDANGLLLAGPYLPTHVRQRVLEVAANRPRLRILEYVTEPSRLLARADRVIAMGGYNTVCEILSFRKTALIVPRIYPRREQIIRAERLRDLGLLDMLHPDNLTPHALSDWLSRNLPAPPPVQSLFDWNGQANLPRLLDELLAAVPCKVRRHFLDCEDLPCYEQNPSESATW
jgi:predicted glycosyltransferase